MTRRSYFIFSNLVFVIVSNVEFNHCYAEKVLVTCVTSTQDGLVLSADSDSNLDQLDFTSLWSLSNTPSAITHDPGTGTIYIVEDATRIGKANINDMAIDTVIDVTGISRVGISVVDKYLYYSDYFGGKIYRAHINGSNVETFMSASGVWMMQADRCERRLYWAERVNGRISSHALDFHDVVIGHISVFMHPRGMVINSENGERYLYGASERFGTIRKHNLKTDSQYDIYAPDPAVNINDIPILGDKLLFLEVAGGLKVISTNGSEPLALEVMGLDDCVEYWSIDVMTEGQGEGNCETSTTSASTTVPRTTSTTTEEAGESTVDEKGQGEGNCETSTTSASTTVPRTTSTTTEEAGESTVDETLSNDGEKMTCYLNKEITAEFNEFCWVLDVDVRDVCRCSSIKIGSVYRKPVTTEFEPKYLSCPMDYLGKDETILHTMFGC